MACFFHWLKGYDPHAPRDPSGPTDPPIILWKMNSLTLRNFRPNLQLLLTSPSLLKASHLPSRPSQKSGGGGTISLSAPRSCSPHSPLSLGLCGDETWYRVQKHPARCQAGGDREQRFRFCLFSFYFRRRLYPRPPPPQHPNKNNTTGGSDAFLPVTHGFPHRPPKASALLGKP